LPLLSILLRLYHRFSKRHFNNLPSDVSRILSQVKQIGSVIDGIKPIFPLPSQNEKRVAGSDSWPRL
jgi:hypothetical protein